MAPSYMARVLVFTSLVFGRGAGVWGISSCLGSVRALALGIVISLVSVMGSLFRYGCLRVSGSLSTLGCLECGGSLEWHGCLVHLGSLTGIGCLKKYGSLGSDGCLIA